MSGDLQNPNSNSDLGRALGVCCLLLFAISGVFAIGPDVVADALRKMSGGLTRAELLQAEARERQERERRDRGQNERRETEQRDREKRDAERRDRERLDTEQRERSQYFSTGRDIDLLRAYVRDCKICAFEGAARTEIAQLEAEAERLRNPTITFRLKNNHPNSVGFAFYSSTDNSRVWPGGVLSDSNVQSHRLTCERGEQICYGAWVQGGFLTPYWGVGAKGRQSCRGCCFTCPAGETNIIALEPREARTPSPFVTWQITKQFSGVLALSFYSTTRRGHSWPGENRVYMLNDQSAHQYSLACVAGETICYGAWVAGNPEGTYWGAGPGARNGCTNCCSVCNGGEYAATLTVGSFE